MYISNDPDLSSIAGLHSLTSVGGMFRIFSSNLTSLDGLESLAWIGGDCSLGSHHAPTSIDAIDESGVPTTRGDTRIQYNSLLCTSRVDALLDMLTALGWTGVAYNLENADC